MKLFGYNITFTKIPPTKPPRKNTSGFSAKRWTDEDKATYLRWTKLGKTDRQIGVKLNRTPAAVQCYRSKLKRK